MDTVIEDPRAPKWIAPRNGEGDDDYNSYIYPVTRKYKKVHCDVIIIYPIKKQGL